jgi:hypothetical protein
MFEVAFPAGSPEWRAARRRAQGEASSPAFKAGMIHGAYDAARPARLRLGYCPQLAASWMYRRGFARAFLAARKETRT